MTYDIGKVNAQTVHCMANTANLVASNTVKVAALGTFGISPLTATFAATDLIGSTKDFTVVGGLKPYTFAVTACRFGNICSRYKFYFPYTRKC